MGTLRVRARWGLGTSRFVEPGRRLPSGGVENYLDSIDPQGVAVPFLPVAERHCAETSAQPLPDRDSGVELGQEPPHGRAGEFQHLVDQERQQRQCGEHIRQMLAAVSEVGFRILDVLQGGEGLVLDFPAAASCASQVAGVGGVDRQIGDPGELPPSVPILRAALRALQHIDFQIGVGCIPFQIAHHSQPAIPFLSFGRGGSANQATCEPSSCFCRCG